MEYARESVAHVWDEAMVLALAHAEEVGPEDRTFSTNRETYEKLELAGVAHVYTMRTTPIHDGLQGQLIGYAVFHLMPHHHYGGMWATQDAVYVLPEYRGIAAVKFMVWTDGALARDGATTVIRHSTVKRDHSRTLERLGYNLSEMAYVKEL